MEAVGLILVILIIVGAVAGVSSLTLLYYLQKRVVDLYSVYLDIAQKVVQLSEEVSKCQKDS